MPTFFCIMHWILQSFIQTSGEMRRLSGAKQIAKKNKILVDRPAWFDKTAMRAGNDGFR